VKLQCSIKSDVEDSDGSYTDVINRYILLEWLLVFIDTNRNRLFYGSYLWKYIDTKTEDNKEVFSTINISLAQKPTTISAGLDNSFAIDEVTLEGKEAKRFRTITKAPPIFQIYLQRQEFDAVRNDSVVVKHHIQLEEVIYLDRFMTLDNAELHRVREQSWALDSRLSRLIDRRGALLARKDGVDGPDVLDMAWQFVSSAGEEINADDPSLAEDLKQEMMFRRDRIAAFDRRIKELEQKRASMFAPFVKQAYRLAAVFVHRGQGGSMGGHYWIYIFDFKAEMWRKYEDQEVQEVTNLQDIFGEKDPQTEGAPYFVVYVRDELKDEVMDAFCRAKPEQEAALVEDMEEDSGAGMNNSDADGSYELESPSSDDMVE
jgi:ubiquitin carboxyl-terminal hydrolase 25/28